MTRGLSISKEHGAVDANGQRIAAGSVSTIHVPTSEGPVVVNGAWESHGDDIWCFTGGDHLRSATICWNPDHVEGQVLVGTTPIELRGTDTEVTARIVKAAEGPDHLDAEALGLADDLEGFEATPLAAGASYADDPNFASCSSDERIDVAFVWTSGGFVEAGLPSQDRRRLLGQLWLTSTNAFFRASGVDAYLALADSTLALSLGGPAGPNLGDSLTVEQIQACVNTPSGAGCPSQASLIEGFADAAGADIVAVITDGLEPQNEANGIANGLVGFFDDGFCSYGDWTGSDASPNLTVQFNQQGNQFSFSHEIGHVLGANHALEEAITPAFGDNSAMFASDCAFKTIMASGSGPCSNFVARVPYFSNPCVMTGTASPNPLNTTTSSLSATGIDGERHNARIMNLAAPYVASVRAQTRTDRELFRAILLSPSNGTSVAAGTTTVSWLDVQGSATNDYRISVGTTIGASNLDFKVATDPTSSVTVTTPSAGTRFYIRLETKVKQILPGEGDAWASRDYRFNNVDVVRDCASEPGILAVPLRFAVTTCNGACTLAAANTLRCTVNDGSFASNPGSAPWIAMLSDDFTNDFDHLAYGWREQPSGGIAPFCCVYRDPTSSLHFVEVEGSQRSDRIRLSMCNGETLAATAGVPLSVTVSGFAGGDEIVGSTSTQSTYSETLLGLANNDTINGGAGNDDLFGGAGNDRLSGGHGDDFLYGEAGLDKLQGNTGVDYLDGGDDADDVCDADAGDVLCGGAGNDAMNWSSTSTTFTGSTGDAGTDTCVTKTFTWALSCEASAAPTSTFWSGRCLPH